MLSCVCAGRFHVGDRVQVVSSASQVTAERGHSAMRLDFSAPFPPMVGSIGTAVAGWRNHPWQWLAVAWDEDAYNFGNCTSVSCGDCTLALLMQYVECSSVEILDVPEVGAAEKSEPAGNSILWVMLALAGAAFFLFTASFLALLWIWLRRSSNRAQRSAEGRMDPVTVGAVEPPHRRSERADRDWKRCKEVRYRSVERACNGFASDSRISEGTSGEVYRGTWRSTRDSRQAIVVKLLRQGSVADDLSKTVEALRHCRHPNIVPLLAFCAEPPCIVMPFIGGGSLEVLLLDAAQRHTWHWLRWLQIACGTLRALAYLHGSSAEKPSIVHRNVKPDNVLIHLNGEARLVDAHMVELDASALRGHSSVRRSLAFMDPECPSISELTAASDMYSFGVILFQLLCVVASDCVAEGLSTSDASLRWETPLRNLMVAELCDGWPDVPATETHSLALECTNPLGAQRPLAGPSLQRLETHEEKSFVEEPTAPGSPRPCVIDLCNPRSGKLLPCNHWCVCDDCALILIVQRQPCPICREPVQGFLNGANYDQTFVQ